MWIVAKRFGGPRLFLAGTYPEQQQPPHKRDTLLPTGVLWGPQFRVLWQAIGHPCAVAMKLWHKHTPYLSRVCLCMPNLGFLTISFSRFYEITSNFISAIYLFSRNGRPS